MKTTILFLFLMQALYALSRADNGFTPDDPRSEEAWLKTGIASQLPKFQRVIFATYPDDKDIVAVNCEIYESWTGGLLVFHHTGDKIDWFAKLPKEYVNGGGAAYIMSCEWRHLGALNMNVLEVFDSSHMGNGALWLFTLEGHDLRLLLSADAVNLYHAHKGPAYKVQSTIFRNGQLNVEYRVPPGGKYEAVYLTGTILNLDENDKVISTKPYSETWTWDTDKRIFTLFKRKD